MSRLFNITSVLALAVAAPAVAQQADPMAQPPIADAPVAAPSETMPTPAEPSAQPVTPAPVATPAPAAPEAALTQETQVTALVETEFPSYDADKTGELSQPEFTKWVMALQAKASEVDVNAKKMDGAAKAKWAKAAFASADTDKSKKISKVEMGKFLLG